MWKRSLFWLRKIVNWGLLVNGERSTEWYWYKVVLAKLPFLYLTPLNFWPVYFFFCTLHNSTNLRREHPDGYIYINSGIICCKSHLNDQMIEYWIFFPPSCHYVEPQSHFICYQYCILCNWTVNFITSKFVVIFISEIQC